jgi:hypothetical protein
MLLVPSYEEFRISSGCTLEDPVFRRVVLDRGDHRLRRFVYSPATLRICVTARSALSSSQPSSSLSTRSTSPSINVLACSSTTTLLTTR